MSLKSLVLCSDEKILRVLRRTLGDLDIEVELCPNSEAALRKLTRQRFEAIVVDCSDSGAPEVLRSSRSALWNQRTIAVAIVDSTAGLRSIFDLGAHFVLYKPVSSERARSSFRAARALMKRERRRNFRVPINISVLIQEDSSASTLKVTTIDLSEGGMAIKLPKRTRRKGRCQIHFTLPGGNSPLALDAEIAWEGSAAQSGLRFLDVPLGAATQLREWLKHNSPESEQDDPPVQCRLTDLSLRACYLEVSSPFPISTRVTLSMKAAGVQVSAQGVVRVMHPDKGMGVEFTHGTPEQSAAVEKFLNLLTANREILPELWVEPEGLEERAAASSSAPGEQPDDPLLKLFCTQSVMLPEAFFDELRKQRGAATPASA